MKQYRVLWVEKLRLRYFDTNNQEKALMLAEYLDKSSVRCRFYDYGELI